MSLHKLTAGDGYQYLIRQVAVLDASDRGYASLGAYYAQRGEAPGVWMGRGLAGLTESLPSPWPEAPGRATPGAMVTEAQMAALFGQGRHPDAEAIEADLATAGHSPPVIETATRLGTPFQVRDEANAFRSRVAQAFAEVNQARGVRRGARLSDQERARIRTRVAEEMFTERYGRAPLDARERSGFIARACRQATTAVAGYDLTFSPVKSVSALWAIAPRPVMTTIESAHAAAVADTLAWLEDHAAYTRLGRAGIQQVDVRGLMAVAFTHRDSRAGDPDLHTHVAISNKVQTLDGRWRALDGRTLHKLAVAASERYNTRLEAELVDRLGVAFTPRPAAAGKRPVRELVGFHDPPPAPALAPGGGPGGAGPARTARTAGTAGTGGSGADLLAVWSARRSAIEDCQGRLTVRFQADHGRPPTPVEAIRLAQQATLQTRPGKHAPRTHAEQRAAWRQQATTVLGGQSQLTALVTRVLNPGRTPRSLRRPSRPRWLLRRPALRRPGLDRPVPAGADPPGQEWVERTAAVVVATVQSTRATWQDGHLLAEAQRRARADGVAVNDLDVAVDAVLAHARRSCLRLGVPDPVDEPAPLRRRDGVSVYTVAATQLYTSEQVLAAECSLLATASRTDGRRCTPATIECALVESAANGIELNPGQARLVRDLACSGSRLQVVLAPAGTGKTTALSVLARAWREDGGHVIGLAPSAAAAAVLRTEIDAPTDTLAKLLHTLSTTPVPGPVPDGVAGIGPGTLVLVDEAGMASTSDLARIVAWVTGRGGSVRLIGDDQQLAAIGAGGVLRDIADVHGALTLTHTVRFTDPSEGAACLALREGDPAALGFYLDHGRVHVGDIETVVDQAYQAWAADRRAGVDAVMLAPTRNLAAALNTRAHTDLLATGEASGPAVTLADGSQATTGDVITTRVNDRRLPISATDWVKNGDRWHVTRVHPDGALDVTHLATRRRARLPASYTMAHVALGYATTVHAAQGITADVSHVVAVGEESRQMLYVALTRGRRSNHVYLAVTGNGDPHTVTTRDALLPPTAAELLARILAHDGPQSSATTAHRRQAEPSARLRDATARYDDAVHTAARRYLGPEGLAALNTAADTAFPYLSEQPAWPALQGHLALIALTCGDPIRALQEAIDERELDSADDVAAVLVWRLGDIGCRGGPLPWLPGLPTALDTDPEWGPYLRRRSDLVTSLAARVTAEATAWTSGTAPAWALPLLHRGGIDPTLVADLAVWRAVTTVPDTQRRPSGPLPTRAPPGDPGNRAPGRTGAEARHQRRLDDRVAAVLGYPDTATARWAPLAGRLCGRLVHDPFWPVLADRLTTASRAGVDVDHLLTTTAAERPLPDEHPASALWWRLHQHLPPTRTTAVVPAPPPWRASRTDDKPSHGTETPVHDDTDKPTETGVPRSRILELNAQAMEFFLTQYPRSWVPAYLADRLGTTPGISLGVQEMFAAGYAPPGWTTLITHLHRQGATQEELLAAGLATRTRHGRLIDRFRDRLILPVRGPDGVHGFIARRNPHHDCDACGPKYLNTPTTAVYHKGDLLYGLTEATGLLAAGARPVLVEGPLDAIAITLTGGGRYVGLAPLGTALTDTQADLLRPYLGPGHPGVIVATDADPAGHAAAERAYRHLTTRGDRPALLPLPDGLDPADLLHHAGPAALAQAMDNPTDLATTLIDQRVTKVGGSLRSAEDRVYAARASATLIAALPLPEWMPLIEHLATRTHLPAVEVGLMVFDASQTDDDDSCRTATSTPRPRNPAAPKPRDPAPRPSKQPGSPLTPETRSPSAPPAR
jgi:DNA primase catalytic core